MMRSNTKTPNYTDTCLSAVSVNSSARNGIRVTKNHDDDVASVTSSSASVIQLNSEYTPFIEQNLKKVIQTKSGKLSLKFCVGNRLAAIQRYESKLSVVSGCGLYFDADSDPKKNTITIVANDTEHMVNGINTIASMNGRLKTHGVVMETIEIPLPLSKIKNIIPVIELMESLTTFETPLVRCSIGPNLIVINGPSTQITDVVDNLIARLDKLVPKQTNVQSKTATAKSTAKEKAKATAKEKAMVPEPESTTDSVTESKIDDFTRAYIRRMNEENEETYDAESSSLPIDGIGSDEVEDEVPIRSYNRSVKPPSKADTARVKASGGRSSVSSVKRFDMSEYEAEDDQIYCVIIKIYGGPRVSLKVISKEDELFNSEVMGHIRRTMTRRGNKAGKGKNLKSHNRLAPGDVVLASKRDFVTNAKVLDIFQKVPDDFVQTLVHNNLIPKSYYENPFGVNSGYGYDDDNDDCGFVFSHGVSGNGSDSFSGGASGGGSGGASGGGSARVSARVSGDFDIDFDSI
jgi:hypothetical protein